MATVAIRKQIVGGRLFSAPFALGRIVGSSRSFGSSSGPALLGRKLAQCALSGKTTIVGNSRSFASSSGGPALLGRKLAQCALSSKITDLAEVNAVEPITLEEAYQAQNEGILETYRSNQEVRGWKVSGFRSTSRLPGLF
jgi:hypothetical protein